MTVISAHTASAASRTPADQTATPFAAWGGNEDGELGDGTYDEQRLPEQVTLAPNVDPVTMASGGAFSLAIGSDSQLYSWGNNAVGELGNGTASSTGTAAGDGQAVPKPISLSPGRVPTAVSAGRESAIALDSTGHVWTWGYNGYGDLGDGTDVDRHSPVPVALPGGDRAGSVDAEDDSMAAVGVDGKVFTWGYTAYYVLGRDTGADAPADVPVQIAIPGDDPVRQVSLSEDRGLAVGTDGKLFSWGYTYVGDGTSDSQPAPVQISLPSGISAVAVAAGDDNDMVLGSDGQVYVWGSDEYGNLGDGGPSTKVQLSPEAVTLPGGDPAVAITDAVWPPTRSVTAAGSIPGASASTVSRSGTARRTPTPRRRSACPAAHRPSRSPRAPTTSWSPKRPGSGPRPSWPTPRRASRPPAGRTTTGSTPPARRRRPSPWRRTRLLG